MTQPGAPFVSVVVPCRNEGRHIERCLESILAAKYPQDSFEVLVVDGESTDNTRELVLEAARRNAQVRLIPNPRRITPAGLNAGIREARGDVIIIMGAHAGYPPHYVARLVEWLQSTGADLVGGACITQPGDDSPMARAIASVMSHPFGVGNSHFRIGTREPIETDTVPFGCYRREVFSRVGLFDEELVRNQDDELSLRLIKAGGRILLVPDVTSTYYARARLDQVARMFYQYGYFKPLVIRKLGRVMTARQLAPGLLVLGLLVAGIAGVWWSPARLAFGILLSVYLAATLVATATLASREGLAELIRVPVVFSVVHFSYGIGFLRGLLRVALGRSAPPEALVPLSRGP